MTKKTVKKFIAPIISNREIAPGYFLLDVKMPGARQTVVPGQFFNIKITSGITPLLRRPFSAHKIEKDAVKILYKVVGQATTMLRDKKCGDTLDILGPLGNGFSIPAAGRRGTAFLVGGGHGVAPLYALAERLKGHTDITVLIGGRSREHIIGAGEFRKLGAEVLVATDDGSSGHRGFVTDILEGQLRRIFDAKKGGVLYDRGYTKNDAHTRRSAAVYACGPAPMLSAVSKIAEGYTTPCQVSVEEYMGCGTGICMGCAIDTTSGKKLVCRDGPVFNGKDIVWKT